jgi:hypothetical protein
MIGATWLFCLEDTGQDSHKEEIGADYYQTLGHRRNADPVQVAASLG